MSWVRAMSAAPSVAHSRAAPAGLGRVLSMLASVSRVHIVAIGGLGTFTFGWLFTGRHLWLLSAVSALDWFLVNLLNRVVDLPEDTHNRIVGTDFVARHRRAILWLGVGILFASFGAVHLVAPAITPLRFAFHALGFAYNWPLLPGRRRIKQLYFWKNTASATGFMLTVFGYPLAGVWSGAMSLAGGVATATILFSAAFFFPFELSYEVIYDLRDAPGDAAADVRTYPVVHGARGAVRIIDALLASSLAALALGYGVGAVPWRIAVMGAAPALQLVLYKRCLTRGITSSDCVRITWLGAVLLAAYHLWVLAKLPGVGS
jgi:4-hydroxybenzoate polyprenyltransferase